jgi:hypothetical protein
LGYIRPIAHTLARIAAGQYGRITVKQLLCAGVDRDRIRRWVADGRLRREHVGVYALGHPDPSARGVYMAAALAAGSGAVVSHRAAAHLLLLVRGGPPAPEVTIPAGESRTRPGICIHRSALPSLDASILDAIAITTVPRTLLDLAPHTEPELLTRMCHEAWVQHRTTPRQIDAAIARNPHKPGAAKLRRAVTTDATLSELESKFASFLKRHDLPKARTNIDHAGDKVDCHWPAHNLTVELHSYRFHATRHAFEQDLARRRRSNHIAYSYGDVTERALQTADDLRARLAAAKISATAGSM